MKIYLSCKRVLTRYAGFFMTLLLSAFCAAIDAILPRKSRSGPSARHSSHDTGRVLWNQQTETSSGLLQGMVRPQHILKTQAGSGPDEVSMQSCLPYQHPLVKKALWNFKYYLKRDALDAFADIMHDEIISHLSEGARHRSAANTYIIYVPSSSYLAGTKDFDHMKELSRQLEAFCAAPGSKAGGKAEPPYRVLHDALLVHKTMTRSAAQHTGNRAQRAQWSKGKYSLDKEAADLLLSDPHAYIVCIDDVITTGATMAAAVEAIRAAADCPVSCIALTHR